MRVPRALDPSRRAILAWGAAATAAVACGGRGGPREVRAPGPGVALEGASIDELGRRMAAGELSARALVTAYLARIDELDRRGPALRAVLDRSPTALAEADALDRERAAGTVRGPLHGIPILLKDNIATADGTPNSAGSLALAEVASPGESEVARRLRAAGAILLGKASLSEWANFRSTRATSAWSARGGLGRNPHALDRTPCGSSSGSAIAAAASLAAAAVGTETNGSIVCPSSMCGVVGLKPTVGLVSRALVIPIADTQDTPGPIGRSVRDVAHLLGALAGPDETDDATLAAAEHAHADYTRFLDADGLRGARLGVARKLTGYDPNVDAIFADALEVMRRRGAVLVDEVDTPVGGDFGEASLEVLLHEFKHGVAAYLARLGGDTPVRTVADLVAFNREHAAVEMPYFGQELFEMAAERGPLTDAAYRDALVRVREIAGGLERALQAHRLDALVAPTGGPAWVADLANGDHYVGGASMLPAVAGAPHITVPAGQVFGLPIGLSIFAGAFAEPTLLRLAYAYEQATEHRRAPTFAATAAL